MSLPGPGDAQPGNYPGDYTSANSPYRRNRETCPECDATLAVFFGGDEAECEECGWNTGPTEDPAAEWS